MKQSQAARVRATNSHQVIINAGGSWRRKCRSHWRIKCIILQLQPEQPSIVTPPSSVPEVTFTRQSSDCEPMTLKVPCTKRSDHWPVSKS